MKIQQWVYIWVCCCTAVATGISIRCSAQGSAQYVSQKLADMANSLKADYGIDCNHMGLAQVANTDITVTRNISRKIDHIGFRLFPKTLTEQNPSPIYNFLERYLLEIVLTKSTPEQKRMLQEDKVKMRIRNNLPQEPRKELIAILPEIVRTRSLVITTDNNYYSVLIGEWEKPLLFMRFPIQYELLWSTNKKEAENCFYDELLHYREKAAAGPKALGKEVAGTLVPLNDSCYCMKGEPYIIEAMNNDCFYKREGERYLPIYDAKYPLESIQNLFLLDSGKNLTMAITQRLYSNRKLNFEMPLHKFTSYCKESGCSIYVGIETCEKHEISGTLIILNSSMGFCHLAYFKINPKMLLRPEAYKIEMDLYTYVPTHNINNLFYDNK